MPKKKTTEQCIADFKKVHGEKYDYSKVVYQGKDINVDIICKWHGIFPQTPHNHIQGRGCPICGYEKIRKKNRMTNEEFEKKANKIHNGKYSYDKTDLENRDEKGRVVVTCKIHGDFLITQHSHLQGYGCQECGKEVKRKKNGMKTETFIEKANKIHSGKYKYDKTDLENRKDKQNKIIVTCTNHGDFLLTAHEHLSGRGCPYCKSSKIEQEIRWLLLEKNIEFEEQKRFQWLQQQTLDFYLPKYNLGIECQGIQHFKVIDFSGHNSERALKEFDKTKKRDNKKLELCNENDIKLLYYANYEYDFPYEVITDKNKLLEEIIHGKKKIL